MGAGQKKKAVILHVDVVKLEVHVSLCRDLVNRKAKKVSLPVTLISVVLKALYTFWLHTFCLGVVMQMLGDRLTLCLVLSVSFPVYTCHPGVVISSTDFHWFR